MWAVLLAPTVAALTSERARPRAFSFIFAAGIGLGVFGGLLGGNLPNLMMRWTASRQLSLQIALLLSCCLILLAVVPLTKLPALNVGPEHRQPIRISAPLRRYLFAIAFWHLGTGAFNPFFNVYFLRLGFSVPQVGSIFALAQAMQTIAVLAAPALLRKSGLTAGVALMQGLTGAALLLLAFAISPTLAVTTYAAYMALQFMSGPGMYSLLMEAVPAADRSTASALNFAAVFAFQAIASGIAGLLISRYGYRPVFLIAAMLCVVAGLAFLRLRDSGLFPPSDSQSANETASTYTDPPTHAGHSQQSSGESQAAS